MMNTTASRLSAALLGYMILIVLLFTLNPFYFSPPGRINISLFTSWEDMGANIILFLPIGFLYRLTGGRRWDVLIVGAIFSFVIEAIQIFIPTRTSSVMDLVCNTIGAGLGMLIHDFVAKRLAVSTVTVGRLRLETPLLGLTYLMLPLLWVDGLALGESYSRWFLGVLLGICGAILFSESYFHWFGGANWHSMLYTAFTTGIWFLIGWGIGWLSHFPILPIAFGITLLSILFAIMPLQIEERRFERITLWRLLPFFLFYVLLMALWDPFRAWGVWHGMFGITTRLADVNLNNLYSQAEYIVAFSVMGYITSEWRGREELSLKQDLPRLLIVATGSAVFLEFLIGFQDGSGASLIRGVLAILNALLGGTIYHLLRAHVRFLLGTSSK